MGRKEKKTHEDPFKKLLEEYQDNLSKKQKELEEKEKFLLTFELKLNEKDEELSSKEKAIQSFLKEEIDSIIDGNKDITKEKRKLLIKKATEEILLNQIEEIEESEEKERKFLRTEYQKLKHSLFHEFVFQSGNEEEDEEEIDINDQEIERIKQELKEELEYLEKRHPSMAKQELIDLTVFDSVDEDVLTNFKKLYANAKNKYSKFVLLTFVAGKDK